MKDSKIIAKKFRSNSQVVVKKLIKFCKKNMKGKHSTEDTFDFQTLPFPLVCQKRFAEICDPETLAVFAQINAKTRNLARGCHIIKDAEILIDDSNEISCKYKVACYCKENEYCKGITADDLSSFNGKIKVMNSITIKATEEQKLDYTLLQHLPVNLNSCKHLKLIIKSMDLETLKKLITPQMKSLAFHGGIESNCSLDKFVDFIKSLSAKLDKFLFYLYSNQSSLSFDFVALIQHDSILQSQNFKHRITHLPNGDSFVYFIKDFKL